MPQKPVVANEGNQMPASGPKNPARRERRLAKRAARRAQDGAETTGTQTGGRTVLAPQASKDWATAMLTGKPETVNPYFAQVFPKEAYDPTTDPILANIKEQLKRESEETFLQGLNASDTTAEQGGRFGGDLWRDLRTRTGEESMEAYQGALSSLYGGAKENEAQRRAALAQALLGTQESAARIPIEWENAAINRGHLGVARGQLGLQRSQFGFEKQMALANAQQDALNDYFGILAGIGGLGGSQWGQGSGQFIPTQNPWAAAAAGGLGGYMQGYGAEKGGYNAEMA